MDSGLIAIGAVVGLLFGTAIACLNTFLTKHYVKKSEKSSNPESLASVMGLNVVRFIIDAIALAIVYFTRNLIPLPYYATLTGTAVGLTVVSYFLLLKYLK